MNITKQCQKSFTINYILLFVLTMLSLNAFSQNLQTHVNKNRESLKSEQCLALLYSSIIISSATNEKLASHAEPICANTDTIPPTITCPSSITQAAVSGLCEAVNVELGIPDFEDNSPGAVLSNNAPSSFPVGVTTVVWTVTDIEGLTATCTQLVTITDDEAPTFEDVSEILLYSNDFESPLATPTQNTCWTDLSSTPVNTFYGPGWQQSFSVETVLNNGPNNLYSDPSGQGGDYSIGTLFPNDRIAYTFDADDKTFLNIRMDISAIDIVGCNSGYGVATPIYTVTVYDSPGGVFDINNPGTILDQSDVTGFIPGATSYTHNWATVIAGLNINSSTDGNVTIEWKLIQSGYAAFDNLEIKASNLSIESNCPEDLSLECIDDIPSAAVLEGFDNCDVSPTIDFTESTVMTGVNNQIITREWTVIDIAGNSTTCTQIITVEDDQAPTISCPAPINQTADVGMCVATNVDLGVPLYDDNCSGAVVSNDAPSSFPVGETTVIWTVTDAEGLTTTCAQLVTITDDEAPWITCPDAVNQTADAFLCGVIYPDLGVPTFGDNCSGAFVSHDASPYLPVGETIVTWTVTDAEGLTATCTQSVTITDDEAPILTCPADITLETGSVISECNAEITAEGLLTYPGVTFPTGPLTTVGSSLFMGPGSPNDVKIVVPIIPAGLFSAGEAITLSFSSVWTRKSSDTDVRWLFTDGSESQTAGILLADNSGGQVFKANGAYSPGGTTVPFQISDPINCSNCFPFIGGQYTADITVEVTSAGAVSISGEMAGDNNTTPTPFAYTYSEIFDPSLGINLLFAREQNNNAATYQLDELSFSCNVLDANEVICTAVHDWDVPIGADNCDVSITRSAGPDGNANMTINSGDEFDLGTTTICYQATDIGNNTAECCFTVTVVDETDPVEPVLDDIIAECDVTVPIPTTLDNCAGTIVGTTLDTLIYDEQGIYQVNWTFDDGNDNVISVVQNVIIEDNIPPDAICQDLVIQLDDNGEASIVAADLDGGSSDACGITLSINKENFDCSDVGDNLITLTVTDANGNESTCESTVFVEDNVPPLALCNDITVYLDSNGEANIVAADIDGGSSDACGISIGINESYFDCGNIGPNMVVLTATDLNDNVSFCEATILIVDNTVPIITDCPVDAEYCGEQPVVWTAPIASDNCLVSFNSNYNSGDIFPVGVTTVTYTAVDAGGNVATCSFDITIHSLPIITIHQGLVPNFCQGISSLTAVVENEVDLVLPLTYTWSNGLGNDSEIIVNDNGTYAVSVVDGNGCETVANTLVNEEIWDNLSSYILLGKKQVHLKRSTVNGGGVGVVDAGKKAKATNDSHVYGFMRAPVIQITSGSSADMEIEEQADITLPPFYTNDHDCDTQDIVVGENEIVTLSEEVYGQIEIEDGGTLIFDSPEVYIDKIDGKDDVNIEFLQPSNVMILDDLKLDVNSLVNNNGHSVTFYVGDQVDIQDGASFFANIYAVDQIHIQGKSNNHSTMTGLFITLEKLKSDNFVNWYPGNGCNPPTTPDGPGCSPCDNLTDGGEIGDDEVLCEDIDDPSEIYSVVDPSGGSGAIEYMWLQNTVSSLPPTTNDMGEWEVIAGATNSSYDPGPITETTWYIRCARREGCISYPGESNVVEKIYNSSCVEYCDSKGLNCGYEWIKKVEVGDIENLSNSDGGYGDYTSMSTAMSVGNDYEITLTPGFSGSNYKEYWNVWIDWNQDGILDPVTELVVQENSKYAVIQTIQVPTDAMEGNTLMRISMQFDHYSWPCEDFQYGEVEDYTINVVAANAMIVNNEEQEKIILENQKREASKMDLKVYPNPAYDYIFIENDGNIDIEKVRIFNTDGRLLLSHNFSSSNRYDLPLVLGLIIVEIQMANGTISRKVIYKI